MEKTTNLSTAKVEALFEQSDIEVALADFEDLAEYDTECSCGGDCNEVLLFV